MRRRLYLLIFVCLFFPSAAVFAMSSSNYQIGWDSVNSGGEDTSNSTNYQITDTIGELGTGTSTSASYQIYAGYRGGDDVQPTSTTPSPSPTPSGGGGGSQPPTIYNVQATTTSYTSFLVMWLTDEAATSLVDYGRQPTYELGTVSDPSLVGTHVISVTGLAPCSTYHYRVRSYDSDGNSSQSPNAVITMPCDITAPLLSNIQVVNLTDSTAIVTWDTNEPATSFVEYGLTSSYGGTAIDSGLVTNHAIFLSGLTPGTTYFYRVSSADAVGNSVTSAGGQFTTTIDRTPPTNTSLAATAGDARVELSWIIPPDADFAGVRLIRKLGGYPTDFTDGAILYQGPATTYLDTGLTNGTTYYYGAYAYDASANFASGSLASATPSAVPPEEPTPPVPPTPTPTPTPPPPFPPLPPGTGPLPPGVIPPGEGVTTTPPTSGVTILVQLFGANGSLPLSYGGDGAIGVLANTSVLVRVPASSINGTPSVVVFVLNGSRYALIYDEVTQSYVGTFVAPSRQGLYGGMGQVVLDDGRSGAIGLVLRVFEKGFIYERPLLGTERTAVPGAIVRLFRVGEEGPWDGSAYGQENPIQTDKNGAYAFLAPPGQYIVEVQKEGYVTTFSPPFFNDTNVVAPPVELIELPPPIKEVVSPTSTAIENVTAITQLFGEELVTDLKRLRQIITSPAVQNILINFVIPLVLTVAVVNVASAISLFSALAYLQYLITKPLFLLGLRKRKLQGVVYNAFTKYPADLAIVRLVNNSTGLTFGTQVTDRAGRYSFDVPLGPYRMEVVKPGFLFPSAYAKGAVTDEMFSNPYIGSKFEFSKDATLRPNIPLDPVFPMETSAQLRMHASLRALQHRVAAAGVIVTGVALVLFPSWQIAGVFAVQGVLYSLFRRLHLMPKLPSHGIIVDQTTQKPIRKAVVRLFESKLNKPCEAQVTDHRGRYGFRARKNDYHVTVEADGYKEKRIDVPSSGVEDVITNNIVLERKK